MLIDYNGADIRRPFRSESAFSFVFSGRLVLIDLEVALAS